MLRFLLLVSVCLSALFTLVGAALSREWGWSEYASDELYVVFQTGQDYYLIEVDDTPDDEEKLMWNNERMTAIDCSPDGHAFAFLTEVVYSESDDDWFFTMHVGVVTNSMILDMPLYDSYFTMVEVANNGMAALFEQSQGRLDFVNIERKSLSTSVQEPTNSRTIDTVDLSSQGFVLWNWDEGISVFRAPTTNFEQMAEVMFLPKAGAGKWLPFENAFTYTYTEADASTLGIRAGTYIMDMRGRNSVFLNPLFLSFQNVLSPDAQVALSYAIDETNRYRPTIVDAQSIHLERWLTPHLDGSSYPICFLAFRPEMLIAAP